MKVRNFAFLAVCWIMAMSSRPAAAIQLLDALFLSDGSSVTGVIVEEEPGKNLVLENEEGQLLEYRFKDIERIEKLFVDEEPLIQNRDVVYLKDGVVFRGTIVGRIPEKAIRLELENGQLLDFDMKEIFKIGKEQVAAGVVKTAVIKPKEAEKEEVEIKIQIAMNQLRLKQDRLKQGGDAAELDSLEDEVDRLKNEVEQLEEAQEVVEAEAAEEAAHFAAIESELGQLRTNLLAGAEGLDERINACGSPQIRERLNAKHDELKSVITELLSQAEAIALTAQPDPRIEEIELQNQTTDAVALAQTRLWKDPEYEEQWKSLVAELPYAQRRMVYRETREVFPLGNVLLNAIPFAFIGSWKQKDYFGGTVGLGLEAAGLGIWIYETAAALDSQSLLALGGYFFLAAWGFGLIEPFLFTAWYNGKLRDALELDRRGLRSPDEQIAASERNYVFPTPPAQPRLPVMLVRFQY
jgi:hypothetical protein